MREYSRRLPHWDVLGQPVFVTFRLHGSLPSNRVFPPARMRAGDAFAAMDRLLDQARSGPVYLKRPEIARIVAEAIHDGEFHLHRYELHAYVVMSNHVHILVTPRVTSREWLGPLKGFTARRANQILANAGPFWQDESYDHLVRDSGEFDKIRSYIENNPVSAGLVAQPQDHPWSSALPAGKPAAG